MLSLIQAVSPHHILIKMFFTKTPHPAGLFTKYLYLLRSFISTSIIEKHLRKLLIVELSVAILKCGFYYFLDQTRYEGRCPKMMVG